MAVTQAPGLIGALLVGLSSAKALAAVRRLPLVPVDHLHGHVVASTLRPEPIEAPYLCLVASGGHTFIARVLDPARYEVLGQTLDDAAGEAFDKGARLLGLGYPGGPEIDRLARTGDPRAFPFPRSSPGELDFSFSGLKTSLLYRVRELGEAEGERRRADLAASYQRAIVDALLARARQALEREGIGRLAIGGGVAANSELRRAVAALGVDVWTPPPELCTDNAAMIAAAARFLEPIPYPATSPWTRRRARPDAATSKCGRGARGPLRQARLPPLRGRARGGAGGGGRPSLRPGGGGRVARPGAPPALRRADPGDHRGR